MLITEPGISLQDFMDIFQVARNTVLQELRRLETYNKKLPSKSASHHVDAS